MPGSAGTKRTSTRSLRSRPAPVLTMRIRVWVPRCGPTGAIRIPPGSSRCVKPSGICSIAAVTMMRSKLPAPARAVEPTPQHPLDIVAPELTEPRPGSVGERPVALDRQHVPAKPRQDCGLVAGAGADLQHAVMLLQLQLFGHVGHHERLADGLTAGDAERAVAISVGAVGRLHETLARNLFHGAQYRLIADPTPPQGELKHHLFRRFLSRGHINLVRAAVGAV